MYFFYFLKINATILNNFLNENTTNLLGFFLLAYTIIILYKKKIMNNFF